jgi:hypothetical protein
MENKEIKMSEVKPSVIPPRESKAPEVVKVPSAEQVKVLVPKTCQTGVARNKVEFENVLNGIKTGHPRAKDIRHVYQEETGQYYIYEN